MISRRQQITTRLAQRLALIVPDSTVQLPDGPHVFSTAVATITPWRGKPFHLSELAAITWRDATTRANLADPRIWQLRIIIAGYLAGSSPASMARNFGADILAAVGPDWKFNNLARYTRPVSVSLAGEQKADIIAAIKVTLDVFYVPYPGDTQPVGDNVLTSDGEILTSDGEALTW